VSYGRKIDGVEVQNDEVLDANAYELGLGLEYGLSDKLALSCGYLFANTSPKDIYLSDIDNSLTSSTLAFGGAFRPTPKMSIDLGFLYTIYQERSKEINYGLPSPITESYNRTNMLFAIGVNYSFGKTE